MTALDVSVILFGWIVAGLATVGAQALRDFSRAELEEICRLRDRSARLAEILRDREQVALGVESLRVVLLAVVVIVTNDAILLHYNVQWPQDWRTVLWLIAASVLLLSAIVIWIPRALARLWAAPLLMLTWPVWRLASQIARPLTLCARFVDTVFHRLSGRTAHRPSEASFEDEIRSIVTEGHRDGLLEGEAREMIEGVIELGDVDAAAVMTPRTDMNSMHIGLDWPDVVDFVISSGRTRIPVFDKTRDDVVGILYAKDLLRELAKPLENPGQHRRPLADVLRQPHFVPETKPIDALLHEFQQTANHMAIVLDEYGGVSGLVTIEDILEEIVGEIIDEYDEDLVEDIKQLDNTSCEALARAHIDDVNEKMGLQIPEDGDFDTIGGFVFSQLGHIPNQGEQVTWGNARITVLEASRRRIERVRVEILSETERETA